jgi:predicted secreted protein
MKKLFLYLTMTLAIVASSINAAPLMITDLSKPVVLNASQTEISVSLPSNATTGFSWFVVAGKMGKFLTPVSHTYQAPDSKLAGAGGMEIFTFKVDKASFAVPTRIVVHFSYQKPWEKVIGKKATLVLLTKEN